MKISNYIYVVLLLLSVLLSCNSNQPKTAINKQDTISNKQDTIDDGYDDKGAKAEADKATAELDSLKALNKLTDKAIIEQMKDINKTKKEYKQLDSILQARKKGLK